MPGPVIVAVDIGGGHVTAGVVDVATAAIVGTSVCRRETPGDASAGALVAAWADAALAAAVAGLDEVAGVGIAMPAPFDYAGGVSLMRHKFEDLFGVDVGAALRRLWAGTSLSEVPVVFGNDADLWTLGEAWAGAARGVPRVIGVTLGTGLGAGFVADGRVVTGGPDVPPDGELWAAPFRNGIAEQWASGTAVTRAYEVRTGRSAEASVIAASARQDQPDADAVAVLRALGEDLGEVLRPWVDSFGADVVVVGGNLARAFDLFGPSLRAQLRATGVDVRVTARFEDSTLLGAARLASTG